MDKHNNNKYIKELEEENKRLKEKIQLLILDKTFDFEKYKSYVEFLENSNDKLTIELNNIKKLKDN